MLIAHGADVDHVCFRKSVAKLIEETMPSLQVSIF
jgi:hypothetical protein